ncbi:UNVERIFIED_CONTAM: hypothetical protein GTU68_013160 [Idotea baltica]|nr:hypothetical protein [Idotea baltica]
MIKKKITFVGAGPGDPDLISVKGLRAIENANVILYDALVHPDLLNSAKSDAVKVYVGKRANKHRFPQQEINEMLVEYAEAYGNVVRLKGGDSFVFGRGHEELSFAQTNGIETSLIPGISSCYSVPELQEVPLTCRGVNESFWVITGTTRYGMLSSDLTHASKSTATVVILMGMGKLSQIVRLFDKNGRGNEPIMIVENGSLSTERKVLATVNTIEEQVKKHNIAAPAIITIGEVVSLHKEWKASPSTEQILNPIKKQSYVKAS